MPRYGDLDALLDKEQASEFVVGVRNGKTLLAACKNYLKMVIDNAPTADVVEVVRCKDCKHHNETWCDMNSRDRGEWFNWYDDDFCSYAERRNDETERSLG